MTIEQMKHCDAVINGVRLHYVEAGKGPLVVLLHGFPEFWYSWRHQISALAKAGFRVVAPDQRGYNTSEKPQGVKSYTIDKLSRDVVELVKHLGEERATIAGHDWGGAIAWYVALAHPEVVDKLIILNAPHPKTFMRELRTPSQLLKSWYIFFFQLPRVPELTLRFSNWAALEHTMRKEPVREGTFSDEDIERYKSAMSEPGALTAAINYYRAAFRGMLRFFRTGGGRRVKAPTLVIWGEQDNYLGPELLDGLESCVDDIRIERLGNASHWVQADAYERVNELFAEFLRT